MRHTPLFELQRERGARFIEFFGWELPVQYRGLEHEHHAVRRQAGLFDVSHMGEIEIRGPQALQAVQWVVTNNAAKLASGAGVMYTVMCAPSGGIVDDLLLYALAPDHFLAVVNASRVPDDVTHWQQQCGRFDCQIVDASERYAQLALQGPQAMAIARELTSCDLAALGPFRFVRGTMAGADDVLLSRTGYTGEDGLEIYCTPPQAPTIWQRILAAGEELGCQPVGLGARDTLRLEARLALYGNDIDLTTSPLEAGLGWTVKFKKGDFCGREALLAQKRAGLARALVGFELTERGIPRHGYPVLLDEREVTTVTSGTLSPTLGRPIGMAYLPREHSEPGTTIAVRIRKRDVPARVVKTPFYLRQE